MTRESDLKIQIELMELELIQLRTEQVLLLEDFQQACDVLERTEQALLRQAYIIEQLSENSPLDLRVLQTRYLN